MSERFRLRVEDHEEAARLNLIASVDEGMRAVHNHEVGEEDVHCLHDLRRDDLGARIVPVEVQRREDRHQDGVEEAATVGKSNLPKALKHRKFTLFESHFWNFFRV